MITFFHTRTWLSKSDSLPFTGCSHRTKKLKTKISFTITFTFYTPQPYRHTYSHRHSSSHTVIHQSRQDFLPFSHTPLPFLQSPHTFTLAKLAGSLQPCTFRHVNFLLCLIGIRTSGIQGFPALCSPFL